MDSSLDDVVQKLSADETYRYLFKKAFGSGSINPETIGLAIENFLLTKLSFDSKIDQVKAGQATFTEEELRGFVRSDSLDPNLAKHPQGLNLGEADKAALIAFLKTL